MGSFYKNVRVLSESLRHIKLIKLSLFVFLLVFTQGLFAQSDDDVSNFLDQFITEVESDGVTIDETYLKNQTNMPEDMKAALRDSLEGRESFQLTKKNASGFLTNFSTTLDRYGFKTTGNGIKLKNNRFVNFEIKGPDFKSIFGKSDTYNVGDDTTSAAYPVHDINSDLYNEKPASNIDLKDPANNTEEVQYDPETGKYVFSNKIGDEELNAPVEMDDEEYKNYALANSMNRYFKTRSFEDGSEENSSLLNMGLDFSSSANLFGKGGINIQTQGKAELTFSVKTTETDNPTIAEEQRKNTYFDLDNKIRMNVVGSVGDKINLDFNYNTEATFDFDNQFKLEYNGEEDDIVKNFKAGNVSMPSVGTMITVGSNGSSGGQASMILPGYQKLWGFQNTQQWGNLTWSWVVSQQESETETMTISGGAVTNDFEIAADEYDANRHFFLSHFFRDHYDEWMEHMPNTNVSGLNITKIEVWVTNKTGQSTQARNIIGFMDLGEPDEENINNPGLWPSNYLDYPCNEANDLYNQMTTQYNGVRDIYEINNVFSGISGFENGEDYEKVEYARLLSSSEYTLNTTLGYISLNSALNSDEVLAVAFQYTYNGEVHQVGEFSTGSGVTAPNALYLKLLKATSQSPSLPSWDLMMKNVYALDAYNMSSKDFEFKIVYENNTVGTELTYITEGKINKEILLRVMGLDELNSSNEKGSDGLFDWVEGYTVLPDNGRIIFPVCEPFGSHLRKAIGSDAVADKYVYQELYDTTLSAAQQMAEKNKFKMIGSYSSSTSSEIKLNAFNIPQGSVIVTAGGVQLTENIDYTVDYNSGYVRILNEGILESGKTIQISMENQAIFSLQKKTLLGSNLVYRFSDDLQVGASITHLSERTNTSKVAYGSDPISNTVWGLTAGWHTDLPFLTKALDKLPFTDTKEPSSLTVKGEVAQLIAGHGKDVGDDGEVYIDDFESSQIGINIQSYYAWHLASVPAEFDESEYSNSLEYGYNRAKLAWYSIARMMQEDRSETPSNIDDDERSNHYVRSVDEQDLFPNADQDYGESSYVPVLNLAYYPTEKGPYNYDLDLDETGHLNNPEKRWAGITREIETTNFENANIEYIEFWVMDPFIYNDSPEMGGDVYINLGNISEDVLKDGRKSYENGLPSTSSLEYVDTTVWGRVSTKQALTFSFNNNESARQYQDLGYDGLNDEEEENFFTTYVNKLEDFKATIDPKYQAYVDSLIDDPSQDDFLYYRGSDWDEIKAGVLQRYKYFNNPQGNSTLSSDESYSTAATTSPDAEDINEDYTMSESDSYYSYHFKVNPTDTAIGENFIVDTRIEHVDLADGTSDDVKWYQYRIPIDEYESKEGTISDFTSIRFMRMYMTNFEKPIIMRMANMQLVRSEWRTYNQEIEPDVYNATEGDIDLEAVNYEENSERDPVNYILPPGVTRVIDPSQPSLTQLNEQSMVMRVQNVSGRDSRACYKTLKMDMRQYENLEMWVHAEALTQSNASYTPLEDGDLTLFVRLGTDYNDNYYEYELPLTLTAPGNYDGDNESDRYIVWPEDNRLEVPLEVFTNLKKLRNNNGTSATDVFSQTVDGKDEQKVSIVGNPSLSNVKIMMIGVRNTKSKTTEVRSAEVWVNELCLSGFAEDGGWAGNATATVKLADIGTVTASGAFSTAGWGGIEESLMDRQLYDTRSYDISTSLQLGMLLPRQLKLQAPMYYSYSRSTSTPKYDPLNEDLLLSDVLDDADSKSERDSILEAVQTSTTQRSLNFSNVRFNISGKTKRFYDPANLSASYSFSETEYQDETTKRQIDRERDFGLRYDFSPQAKPIEPLKNVEFLNSDYLALIRDFNFYLKPQKISLASNIERSYYEVQTRTLDGGDKLPLEVSKEMYWNNSMSLSYKLTNSLSFDFSAQSEAIIDEPDVVDKDGNIISLDHKLYGSAYDAWWDEVKDNIKGFGRPMDYAQQFNVRYNVPLNKIPALDFMSMTGSYSATYGWERGAEGYYDYSDDGTDSTYIDNANDISNTQKGVINAGLQMTALYNKSKYLADISKKYGRIGRSSGRKKYQAKKYNKDNITVKKGEELVVKHKLGTTKSTLKVYDEDGRVVNGAKRTQSDNVIVFTPNKDINGGKLQVTGRVEEKDDLAQKVLGYSLNALMAVKSVNGTFTRSGTTVVPGFKPESEYFMDNSSPGWDFALGWQNRNIFTGKHDNDFIDKFYKNDWLVTDTTFSDAYYITETDQINLRATVEPLAGLSIKLSSSYRHTDRVSAYFRKEDNGFNTMDNATNSGSYSHTCIAIGTLFEKQDDVNYSSEAYDNFVKYRETIASRRKSELLTQNEQLAYEDVDYDLNSSEIMIPAFLAAYCGGDINGVSLDPTPSWRDMLPNWQITYSGLAKVSFLKDHLKKLTLNHTYTSTYNVGNYTTNPEYKRLSTIETEDNVYFASQYEISSVTIAEGLNPLIGIDLTLKNDISLDFSMNKLRALSLNISSNQLVENRTNEYVFGAGYTLRDLQLFVQTGKDSKKKSVSNDLKVSADFSISDVVTVIRTITEADVQPSSGNRVTSLKLQATYNMNKNLDITMFYDRLITSPVVSTSYKTTSSNFGLTFSFSLTQ